MGESLLGGYCRGGQLVDCRDGDPCTLDLGCGENGQCVRYPLLSEECQGTCRPELEVTAVLAPDKPFRGRVSDVAVQENLVYAVSPAGLGIYELGPSGSIEGVGGVVFYASHGRVAVDGDTLIVGSPFGWAVLVDVSVPRTPAIIRKVEAFPGGCSMKAFDLHDGRVFAGAMLGIWVAPADELDRLQGPPSLSLVGDKTALHADGDFLYVATREGLQVLSIEQREAPALAGLANSSSKLVQVFANDGVVVAADDAGGVQLFDVGDPFAPKAAGSLSMDRAVRGIGVDGGVAWLAMHRSGLVGIDISDPNAPVQSTTTHLFFQPETGREELEWALAIALEEAHAVIGTQHGLWVADLSPPDGPRRSGSSLDFAMARELAVSGPRALLADERGGIRLFDVKASGSPKQTGEVHPRRWTGSVIVDGHLAYATGLGPALRVLDIRQADSPVQVSELRLRASCAQLAVTGPLIVCGVGERGSYPAHGAVAIVDVSEPTAPAEVGRVEFPEEYLTRLVVRRHHVFAGVGLPRESPLRVIDISEPSDPPVMRVEGSPNVSDLALEGSTLYALNSRSDSTVIAYDVSDAESPVELWRATVAGAPQNIAAQGDVVYLGTLWSRLLAFQVTGTAQLRQLGDVQALGFLGEIQARNARVFVASGPVPFNIGDIGCAE